MKATFMCAWLLFFQLLLDPTSGTSDDYAKSLGIRFVYTLELAPYSDLTDSSDARGFIANEDDIPIVGREVLEAFSVIAKHVANPVVRST